MPLAKLAKLVVKCKNNSVNHVQIPIHIYIYIYLDEGIDAVVNLYQV